MNTLGLGAILVNGTRLGLSQFGPLLVNLLLWVLTIWIPYINMGTTVALFAGLPLKLSRGESIGYFELFDKHYRQNVSDFFITIGIMATVIIVSALVVLGLLLMLLVFWWGLPDPLDLSSLNLNEFFTEVEYGNFIVILMLIICLAMLIIPGLILATGWLLALPLCLEKNMNPLKAVVTSFAVTAGHKMVIVLSFLILWGVQTLIVIGLGALIGDYGSFLSIAVEIILSVIADLLGLGFTGFIYQALLKKLAGQPVPTVSAQ